MPYLCQRWRVGQMSIVGKIIKEFIIIVTEKYMNYIIYNEGASEWKRD